MLIIIPLLAVVEFLDIANGTVKKIKQMKGTLFVLWEMSRVPPCFAAAPSEKQVTRGCSFEMGSSPCHLKDRNIWELDT